MLQKIVMKTTMKPIITKNDETNNWEKIVSNVCKVNCKWVICWSFVVDCITLCTQNMWKLRQ